MKPQNDTQSTPKSQTEKELMEVNVMEFGREVKEESTAHMRIKRIRLNEGKALEEAKAQMDHIGQDPAISQGDKSKGQRNGVQSMKSSGG